MVITINWAAVGASVLPNLGGFAGALVLGDQTKKTGWYETLVKPAWRPPNWVFGPVWTYLYSSMGYASYLVYRDGGGFTGAAKVPLILFGSQLALNWIWTPLFFGAHNLKGSLIDISLLWGSALACGISFYKVNPIAGYLFIPYMTWLSLATALNYCIWRDNPEESATIKEIKD